MSTLDTQPVPDAPAPGNSLFVSTRWTLVLSAGRQSSPELDEALAASCQTYWFPLYAYVRRQGHSREDPKTRSG